VAVVFGSTGRTCTPFLIGSLTKSITALAVMQLVEADKVNLDAPVQQYLPWFLGGGSQGLRSDIRAPHAEPDQRLLRVVRRTPLSDFDESPGATERQVRALSTLALDRPVGLAFEYSNSNYNVLRLIALILRALERCPRPASGSPAGPHCAEVWNRERTSAASDSPSADFNPWTARTR
jgi:CubicO group peptidase (beta-lactamase class C family)